ncbi:Rad3-related DNA helicase [Giardia muris]|uniref:Rad3-related DNA helicase n=1 Tax=Giardia muris TaxID=5742 RepID=A0A4Z1T405_GIAMU|nr:Rad3-related DNA helicase [Giardia muris]|eukprot:TNJ27777.1 Rad3-related DNA helicase [Giardia muris]
MQFFPFRPYPSQEEALRFLGEAVHRRLPSSISLLSAPTGTGKTALLLATMIEWFERCGVEEQHPREEGIEPSDWLAKAALDARAKRTEEARTEVLSFVESLLRVCERYTTHADAEMLSNYALEPSRKQMGPYESAFRVLSLEGTMRPDRYAALVATREFLHHKRVLIASRTHVQLEQLRTSFEAHFRKYGRVAVVLGGRDALCIHPERPLGIDIEDIGDFCDSLRNSTGCPLHTPLRLLLGSGAYLKHGGGSLAKERCHELGACPYYSARQAALLSEVIFLTHNSLADELLQRPHSLQLLATEEILILCDEAHAFPDVIASSFSANAEIDDITIFRTALRRYLNKFRAHMDPTTVRALDRLGDVLKQIVARSGAIVPRDGVLASLTDSLTQLGLGRYDFRAVVELLRQKRMVPKLASQAEGDEAPISKSRLYKVLNLLEGMRASATDDIVLYRLDDASGEGQSVRLVRLGTGAQNPFRKLLSQEQRERPALLCFTSGTIEPFQAFEDALFEDLECPPNCLAIRHVAPSTGMHVRYCGMFDGMESFRFVSTAFNDERYLQELCNFLGQVGRLRGVQGPVGTVVFLPSYGVIEKVKRVWTEISTTPTIPTYFESRTCKVSDLLEKYRQALETDNAIILAAAAGRLGEGVDLRDALCRRLVIVGIPLPNLHDPIITQRQARSNGKYAYRRAFQVINQCIGRGIRHSADWCSILLLDGRYVEHKEDISLWAREQLHPIPSCSEYLASLEAFEKKVATCVPPG